MESWCVGFEGNDDVERHAGMEDAGQHSRPAIRLRVVSDYICPWCYIGLTRLEALRPDFDISLETCAYELRPNIPPEGMPREQASAGRVYPPGYLEHLRQTALDAGIEMKRPALVPNTRLAHEMTEFAAEQGKTWQVHRALFAAYFEHERNIGDIDVLCDIAAGIGVDPIALQEALESRRYRAHVEEQLKWAVAAGVTGVPTVIYNERFAVVGAQDEMVFRDVAQRVASGRLEIAI